MENRGKIYAFDVDSARIKRMKEVLKRTGVEIAEVIKADGRNAPELLGEEIADRVLLDAPCTSDGTIAKNPELRWRSGRRTSPRWLPFRRSSWRALGSY